MALDAQFKMLEKVKAKAKIANIENIKFLHAKIDETKLSKGSYDRVLLVNVLGEIPNQESALQEIYHALKPAGILLITETIFDPHFQRLSWVIEITSKIGLKEKRVYGNKFSYTIIFATCQQQ